MIDYASVEIQTQTNYGSLSDSDRSTNESPSSSFMTATRSFRDKAYLRQLVLSVLITMLVGSILVLLVHNASPSLVHKKNDSEIGSLFQSDDELDPTTKSLNCETQRVNHFDPKDDRTWSHPYFVSDDYFRGPGSPIFVILGGEGPIHRILYPFVSKKLAHEFGGYVLQTEHRFYGASQPVGENPSTKELLELFSPEQAIADFIYLITTVRTELGCASSRESSSYCPVVTIGGSYPGFLAAIMRQSYSNVIDIAYAASAPMILNAHHQDADTNAYFDHVSDVADRAWPRCAEGIRKTLKELHLDIFHSDIERISRNLGLCQGSIPEYMTASPKVFATELSQLVVSVSADANMEYYPPREDALLIKMCKVFTDEASSAQQRYANFLGLLRSTDDYQKANPSSSDCFDVQTQLPDGPSASISSADWSGAGFARTGTRWEFQVCKDLVIKCGFAGPRSMFYPPREWTMSWFTEHCHNRFGSGLNPEPGRLNKLWGFDSLEGASRILFTNGANDGWIVGSYTESESDSIIVINYPNGSHHSDLMHEWPGDDTDDIVAGHKVVIQVLRRWLAEVRSESRETPLP